ncbi:MAG: hypothetical protein WCV81_04600 [Microgenomates group bacterium]
MGEFTPVIDNRSVYRASVNQPRGRVRWPFAFAAGAAFLFLISQGQNTVFFDSKDSNQVLIPTKTAIPTKTVVPTATIDLSVPKGPIAEIRCSGNNTPLSMIISGMVEFPSSAKTVSVIVNEMATGDWVVVKELKPDEKRQAKYQFELEGEARAIQAVGAGLKDKITFQKEAKYQVVLASGSILEDPTIDVFQGTYAFSYSCFPKGFGNINFSKDITLPSGRYRITN